MAGEIRIIRIPLGGFKHLSSPARSFADSLQVVSKEPQLGADIFISASNKTTPSFLDYILASLGAKST